MRVYKLKQGLQAFLNEGLINKKNIGLVPTMGALHYGHLSLVKKALDDNDLVVLSIFVNPTQFNNKEDLINYPRTLDSDLKLLQTLNSAKILVYAPEISDIYSNKVQSQTFDFGGMEREMEGQFRPNHFDGVATIVQNLFEIVKPNVAYFGEKDFQQLQIVRKLVKIINSKVQVIGCPILREADGLAMSSRNLRLTADHRKAAPIIYKTLKAAKMHFGTKNAEEVTDWVKQQFKDHPLLELEYFTIADQTTLKPISQKVKGKKYRAFIAVFAGDVRLIDNIELN